ncbi:MAG: hypothetical protein FD180_3250 [Planctomycetota bacterium]|nr:MAG: hypothetical protein FD180_3250 [Planctomycetota bacterium]
MVQDHGIVEGIRDCKATRVFPPGNRDEVARDKVELDSNGILVIDADLRGAILEAQIPDNSTGSFLDLKQESVFAEYRPVRSDPFSGLNLRHDAVMVIIGFPLPEFGGGAPPRNANQNPDGVRACPELDVRRNDHGPPGIRGALGRGRN